MKTIELTGKVEAKSEHLDYKDNNTIAASIKLDGGGELQVKLKGPVLDGLKVGSSIRVLVLDDGAPEKTGPRKGGTLGAISELVSALETAGRKAVTEECLKKADETEGWADKKIEKRHNLGETICASGGIYAPGTK